LWQACEASLAGFPGFERLKQFEQRFFFIITIQLGCDNAPVLLGRLCARLCRHHMASFHLCRCLGLAGSVERRANPAVVELGEEVGQSILSFEMFRDFSSLAGRRIGSAQMRGLSGFVQALQLSLKIDQSRQALFASLVHQRPNVVGRKPSAMSERKVVMPK